MCLPPAVKSVISRDSLLLEHDAKLPPSLVHDFQGENAVRKRTNRRCFSSFSHTGGKVHRFMEQLAVVIRAPRIESGCKVVGNEREWAGRVETAGDRQHAVRSRNDGVPRCVAE